MMASSTVSPQIAAQVWHWVEQIPRGKVMTYGQLAKLTGAPGPRWIGKVLHSNQDSDRYPCHRVVRSNGGLAGGYAFGGPLVQRGKLESEGVVFSRGRIVMAKSQWQPLAV